MYADALPDDWRAPRRLDDVADAQSSNDESRGRHARDRRRGRRENDDRLQDQYLAARGHCRRGVPMAYTPEAARFGSRFRRLATANGRLFWAGIGASPSAAQTVRYPTARKLAAAGVILFIRQPERSARRLSDYLAQVARAAFAPAPQVPVATGLPGVMSHRTREMPPPFAEVSDHLFAAINERAFPAAAIEIGGQKGVLWRRALGFLTYEPSAGLATADTIFDLASLTKVLATTSLAMRAIDDGRLRLEDTVERWIPEWKGNDRRGVTIADLLSHSSGLTAYLPFYRDCAGRIDYQPAICGVPLECAARGRSTATWDSCPGIRSGGRTAQERQLHWSAGCKRSRTPARRAIPTACNFPHPEPLGFSPPRSWRDRTAPTEVDPWRGRLLVGEVHDENTWALGGVAGHAGLFGTVAAVGAFARRARHARRSTSPGKDRYHAAFHSAVRSARELACTGMGHHAADIVVRHALSPTAIGHTGFTGTSLWIDWERDLYVVLLTNRVHPTRGTIRFDACGGRFTTRWSETFDRSFR